MLEELWYLWRFYTPWFHHSLWPCISSSCHLQHLCHLILLVDTNSPPLSCHITAVEFMENPLFSPIYIRSWFLEPDDEIGAVGTDDLWICLFSALSPASLSPCLCHLHVLDWLHLLLNFVSSFRVKSYSMSDTVVHIWSVCKRSFPFASHFMQQRILFRCHSWKRYSFLWLGLLCKFLDGGRFCNLPCLEGYERKSLWCVVKYLCDSDHSSGLRQKGWRSHHATEWWNCGSQHDKQ